MFIFGVDDAAMATAKYLEIETKFDVDDTLAVPVLTGLPGVVEVAGPTEQQLDATYFDTSDLALAAAKVTLRRRTGGEDAGWHLKLPLAAQARREVRAPLGDGDEGVPAELLGAVRVLIRDHAVTAVAVLSTSRRVHQLLGKGGVVLAEVCDDRVASVVPGEVVRADSWREWEVELVDGSMDLLEAAGAALIAAGATASGHASKLARSLGPGAPSLTPSSFDLPSRPSAAEVLITYLQNQIADLRRLDPEFRADEPAALHDLAVTVRRLRSALATYRPLLAHAAVVSLREELKWVGGALGRASDADALRAELEQSAAAQPAELVLGPVAVRIDDDLSTSYQHSQAAALAVLDETRYFRLLDQLDALVSAPPVGELGDKQAVEVMSALVAKDWRRLQRMARRAESMTDDLERGHALNEVRKAAKRLHCAADVAHPLIGRKAARLAAAAKNLQTILGVHHDAVVSREALLRLAAQAQLGGDSSFTYGRLHALAEVRASKADARYRHAWAGFPAPRIARWSSA